MGFNTVLMVLNDFTAEIRADQSFGAKVSAAMQSFPHSYRPDQRFKVLGVQHADSYQVTVVGENTGWDLWGPVPTEALEAVARSLERHGYKVKRPKPVTSPAPSPAIQGVDH